MWVESLGWEDPLEKEMGTHSSFLDCGELDYEKSMGVKECGIFLSHTPIREIETLTWLSRSALWSQTSPQVSWSED